jgi:hsp70-interacting protein
MITNYIQITSLGTIPTLTNLAINDSDQGVRKKAILALSSGVRNNQPALDQMLKDLPETFKTSTTNDANDMDAMNSLMQKLRDASSTTQST